MMWKIGAVAVLALALLIGMQKPHDEAALLSDWSSPPPWPIFIAVNVLAGSLRSAADALTPPPIRILDMSTAYHHTVLVYLAQRFKIPDLLKDGPMTAAAIAQSVKSEREIVERLMYACAAIGVFKLGMPDADGSPRFVNTALSAVLRVDHPNSMRGFVGHNAEDCWEGWGKLAQYVENPTGPIAWDLANPKYPFAKGGIWAKFEKNPASEEQFGMAMTAINALGSQAMVADGPWAQFSRVIDVGGGRGHMLHAILDANPAVTGIVIDREPVIKLAKQAWAPGGDFASAASRAELVAGSFFDAATLPKAKDGDAYYMRYILHDWPTKDVLAILQNIRKVMGKAKATLVIGECALPNHDTVGVPPVMYQIDMQMMVVFGEAKERTPEQWKSVLAQAGFEIVKIHPTRSLVHWVEAKPV